MHKELHAVKNMNEVFRAIVIFGAWLFVCLSIILLLFVLVVTPWNNPNVSSAFFRSSLDGVDRSAWGLFYQGHGGFILVFFETTLLIIALWISTRYSNLIRRIGLIFIVCWALLLLLGGFWVFPNTYVPVFIVSALLFSIGRTIFCWKRLP